MSLEAVKIISTAEQDADALVRQANETAKARIAAAEAQAETLRREAREKAAAEAETLRRAEDEKLEKELQELAEKTENKKAALRARAEARMEEAARLIAGRIVNS